MKIKTNKKSGSERKANVHFGGEKLQETKLEPRFVLGKKKKKTALAKISPIRKKTGLLWNKEMAALR